MVVIRCDCCNEVIADHLNVHRLKEYTIKRTFSDEAVKDKWDLCPDCYDKVMAVIKQNI